MPLCRVAIVVALGLCLAGCFTSSLCLGAGHTGNEDAARCIALASGIGQNLQVCSTDHFLLLTAADNASAADTGRFLERVQNRFYDSFSQAGFTPKPLHDKLVCVCLNSYSQLDAYARVADRVDASWMDGYYSYATNRIAVVRSCAVTPQQAQGPADSTGQKAATYRSLVHTSTDAAGLNLRTVTHEMAHQLAFNCGLQKRDVAYPFWVTEGLATNFEADRCGSFGLDSKDSVQRPRLAATKARGRLLPLEQFAAMTDLAASGQAAGDAYAQAWGLFNYLYQTHRQALISYMSGASQAWPATQDRASHLRRFVNAFGPIESLEIAFLRFADDTAR